MKILIAPYMSSNPGDAVYHLAKHLLMLFHSHNHHCAISCQKDIHFYHFSLYPMPQTSIPFHLHPQSYSSYEEQLYKTKASSRQFLKQDEAHLKQVIQDFKPDLIITINRIMAPVIAQQHHIPCWAIVNSEMYRHALSSRQWLGECNEVLQQNGLSPVTSIAQIYQHCQRRIGFDPIEFSPFPTAQQIDRIGISAITPLSSLPDQSISAFFTNPSLSSHKIKKIMTDTFLGAPYPIRIWYPNARAAKMENLQFLSTMRIEALEGNSVCIHDGNPFLRNQCIARGIPQIIIASHDYLRQSIAMSVKRNNCGTMLYEDEFDVSHLYEQYRAIQCHPTYHYYVKAFQEVIKKDGDLSILTQWLEGEESHE